MATIKDVAKKAGVSVATVSRVINDADSVTEDTKKLVNQVIAELQYSPNLLGRNLRKLQTKHILVIVDTISNQFYSRVVRGIEDTAREQGYSVMICTCRGQKQALLDHLKLLQTRAMDGAIVMCSQLAAEEITALSKVYPIVCACEPLLTQAICSVSIDDNKASFDAVNFLLARGHRKIAVVATPATYTSSSIRLGGYRKALKQAGIPLKNELIFPEGYSYHAGERVAKQILASGDLPDVLFAFSDAAAIGAIKEFSRNGIHVPDDLSVMGFDNTAMSEEYIPSITTVSQPQYQIGKQSTDLLINQINGDPSIQHRYLTHEIISRDSVR